MSSNAGKKHIAHTGSGHGVVFPAAMSMMTPPAPPAPVPFPYTGRVANAKDTDNKIIVDGSHPVLVEGSNFPLDPPANQPSQSAGGDVVTHAVKNIATMTTGSWALSIRGKGICATGDMAACNVITKESHVAQANVPLLEAADFELAQQSEEFAAMIFEDYARAYPPNPAKRTETGHPVDVGTGYVVDAATDLGLPGYIPLRWRRSYSSASHKRIGALGKGGWSHSFEQYIELGDGVFRLFDENGLPVLFVPPAGDAPSLNRVERLELRAAGAGFEIFGLDDKRVRSFARAGGERWVLQEIRDAYGHRVVFHYERGVLRKIVDSVGRALLVASDARGRVTRVEVWGNLPGSTDPVQRLVHFDYEYHPEGELALHRDAAGAVEHWEYDGQHRMTRAVMKNGSAFHYEYHPELGYCAHTWGAGGLHDIHLEIDFEKGETRTHGTPRARLYRWKKGIVQREETFDGSFAADRIRDEDEYLIAKGNGAGEKYEYEYDARGNLVKTTDPAGNDLLFEIVADRCVRFVEPGDLVTELSYDAGGQLVSVRYPTGTFLHLERNRDGLITAIYDDDGVKTKLTYDQHGNLASESGVRGTRRFVHDALGQQIEWVDSINRRHVFHYDAVGNLVESHRPDGTRVLAAYDPLGWVTSLTDPLGRTTRLDYTGTGVFARLTKPDGQVYRFLYDADERLVQVLNPRLETYEFEYDRADRVVAERSFDGRTMTYRYDAAGRVSRVDHPEGEWREYRYDKLGNIVENRGEDVQILYERDALGRAIRAVSTDVTGKRVTELERDRFGRIVADIQDGRAVRFEYDRMGRRAARLLPGGERTEYHYDHAGALTALIQDGVRFRFERDAFGRERRRVGDGWAMEVQLDPMDRLVGQTVKALVDGAEQPRALVERRYAYDAAGRLASMERVGKGLVGYDYDRGDHLLVSSWLGRAEIFEYDPTGSIVGRRAGQEASPPKPWSLAKGNVLTATEHTLYVNDLRGRRIQQLEKSSVEDPPSTIYGWDSTSRLREVVRPDGTRVRYAYDGFMRRVRKDVLGPIDPVASVTTLPARRSVSYLWDFYDVCEEVPSDAPASKRVHVHEPTGLVPLLQIEGGYVFGVITNHLGMPLELVDPAGRIAWGAEHGAWGDVQRVQRDRGAPEVESPFRLLGQIWDGDVGLMHTLFRPFDPETGRWLSPDPLGIDGGLNVFAFDGAPTNAVDPYGLCGGPDILFGQKRAAPTFRKQGPNPNLQGRTLEEVAEDIKAGRIHPDEIPVQFFVDKNGQRVAENNRGLGVLALAGMHPTRTEEIPRTGVHEERLGEGNKSHPLPNSTLPITENKDGTGHLYDIELR